MDYIGWCVVALMIVLFMGLLAADCKLASLQIETGVVVKKPVRSYPLSAPGGAWEMTFRYETFELEINTVWGEVAIVPVSKSQYDKTPLGATIYVKYLETRFLKNKTPLDFAVLKS